MIKLITTLFILALLVIPATAFAQAETPPTTSLQALLDYLQKMLDVYVLLPGALAIVPVAVAVLKKAGVLQDGQSGLIQFVINAALYVLFLVGTAMGADVVAIDGVLEKVAALVVTLIPFVALPIASKLGYSAARKYKVPLVSYEFSSPPK